MRLFRRLPAALVAGLLCQVGSSTASGQVPMGIDATLTELFGKVTAFSAQGSLHQMDKTQAETVNTPVSFSRLDDKLRIDFDLTTMAKMPAAAAQQLKQLNMERVFVILRPDKKQTYLVFPALESTVASPMAEGDPGTTSHSSKVEQSELGKETIDGHPCVKTKLTITEEKGQKRDATTWNASDLKDFPVQIQTTDKDNTLIVRFSQVQLVKPDARQFEPPAGYAQYNDVQELIVGTMKKMIVGGGDKTK